MDIAQATRVGLAIRSKRNVWLAGKLGVTGAYISYVCNGTKVPSVERVSQIAEAFGVDDSTFVSWGQLGK